MFIFQLEEYLIEASVIKVTKKSKKIGTVYIGKKSNNLSGVEHWDQIISSPNTELVSWHPIYSN